MSDLSFDDPTATDAGCEPSGDIRQYDTTGDGVVDMVVADLDGDRAVDVVAVDVDGDRAVDVVVADTDGNGVVDIEITIGTDAANEESLDPDDTVEPAQDVVVDPATDPSTMPTDDGDDTSHGDPIADLQWSIQQSENGFCMPVSVAMIASEFSGQPVSEELAVQTALDMKLLDGRPGAWTGMTAPEGELLLERFGVEAHTVQGDMDDLRHYLDEGRGVILGIDSSEVWEGVDDDALPSGAGADHAVVITGIDDATGMVTLNDPGHPEGAGMQVPLELLADAWADSGNTMVVTDGVPADSTSPYQEGFVLLPIALGAERV